MLKLTQHISSKYVTAANALTSQNSRRKIIAYVESYDDVLFWRTVLNQFENDRRYFEILLPTRLNKRRQVMGRGKKSAISSILRNTGRDMIACVDADYDFLMQGVTENSRLLLDTPYVFHTYAGDYILSPFISFECAVSVNFCCSFFFVWKDRVNRHEGRSFARKYLVYNLSSSLTFLLKMGVLLLLELCFGWNVVICNLIALCISGIINFSIGEWVIFKRRRQVM